VLSNQADSPLVTGYADRRPSGVATQALKIPEASSLERVKAAKSGWYWDQQTKLWYVKVDFSDAKEIQSRTFSIF
jgi:hypothetical protein